MAIALRLIEQRRKVTNILTRDTLPATGMSMEYNVVSEDTTAVDKQTAEGAALTFGKVKFGTKTADINTYGGYTTLSRQTIERSTTPMLRANPRPNVQAFRGIRPGWAACGARDIGYLLIAAAGRDLSGDKVWDGRSARGVSWNDVWPS